MDISNFKDLTIPELDKLIEELGYLRREKFNNKYIVIDIYNYNGNIAREIKEATGLHCQHVASENGYGIGTNKVIVARDQYTEKLKNDLLTKYNDVE